MKRSLKFSLELANTNKRKELDRLSQEYRRAVNYFLIRLFQKKDLSEKFLKSSQSPLSYRYKQCAKRQTFKLFKSWCRNKKKGLKPKLRNPSLILDYRFIELQRGQNSSFDFWLKIATLDKGSPILIPIKSYNYANPYLKDWQFLKGGRLIRQDGNWFLELTFQKQTPQKKEKGKVIAFDMGVKKLITTSENKEYGKDIEKLDEI